MTEMVERIDDYGRPAWIGLMIVGFVLFWPLGLAVLAFLLWSGRMGCGDRQTAGAGDGQREGFGGRMGGLRQTFAGWGCNRRGDGRTGRDGRGEAARGFAPTGNQAFDAYRVDTLKRLEDEAREFTSFLDRLRMAKDKAEFDQFMADRRSRPAVEPGRGADTSDGPEGQGRGPTGV